MDFVTSDVSVSQRRPSKKARADHDINARRMRELHNAVQIARTHYGIVKILPQVLGSKTGPTADELQLAFYRHAKVAILVVRALHASQGMRGLRKSEKLVISDIIANLLKTQAERYPELIDHELQGIFKAHTNSDLDDVIAQEFNAAVETALSQQELATPEGQQFQAMIRKATSLSEIEKAMDEWRLAMHPTCLEDLEYFARIETNSYRDQSFQQTTERRDVANKLYRILTCGITSPTEDRGKVVRLRILPHHLVDAATKARDQLDILGLFEICEKHGHLAGITNLLFQTEPQFIDQVRQGIEHQTQEIILQIQSLCTHPSLTFYLRLLDAPEDIITFDAPTALQEIYTREIFFTRCAFEITSNRSLKAIREIIADFEQGQNDLDNESAFHYNSTNEFDWHHPVT